MGRGARQGRPLSPVLCGGAMAQVLRASARRTNAASQLQTLFLRSLASSGGPSHGDQKGAPSPPSSCLSNAPSAADPLHRCGQDLADVPGSISCAHKASPSFAASLVSQTLSSGACPPSGVLRPGAQLSNPKVYAAEALRGPHRAGLSSLAAPEPADAPAEKGKEEAWQEAMKKVGPCSLALAQCPACLNPEPSFYCPGRNPRGRQFHGRPFLA